MGGDIKEQSLILRTGGGLVVITGCSLAARVPPVSAMGPLDNISISATYRNAEFTLRLNQFDDQFFRGG